MATFGTLSDRLVDTFKNLRTKGRLSASDVDGTVREIRRALLEADVALPVVQELIARVKERAIGQEVLKSLTPGQALVKVVSDELTAVMGTSNAALDLAVQPPAVILMAGLQGAGKTTTVAKLARFLKERHKKKVMVVSCDVYRPAAIDQLETLAGQVGVNFFPSKAGTDPVDIANDAVAAARREMADVLIVDTAGRLGIDHLSESIGQAIGFAHVSSQIVDDGPDLRDRVVDLVDGTIHRGTEPLGIGRDRRLEGEPGAVQPLDDRIVQIATDALTFGGERESITRRVECGLGGASFGEVPDGGDHIVVAVDVDR